MKYLPSFGLCLIVFAVQGCSTTYAPPESMSITRSVPQFDVVGSLEMTNGYSEPHEITVLDSFINTSTADLSVSTDVYLTLVEELAERHAIKLDSNDDKLIAARVTDLGAGSKLMGIGPMESWAEVELMMGAEGEVQIIESKVLLPSGTGYRDALNEALAWAVIETLRDDNVKAYLARID